MYAITQSIIKALPFIFFFSQAFSADYLCDTEFGELVPVRKKVFLGHGKSKKIESEIEYPSASSKAFHGNLNSKVKLKEWSFNEGTVKQRTVHLETGYTKIAGPSFSFRLNCKTNKNCEAYFLQAGEIIKAAKHQLEIRAPKIFDLRYPENKGFATIEITRRGPPGKKKIGFLARVFKEKAFKLAKHQFIATSASGEIKFSGESEFISFDTGADEQIELFEGQFQRIATFELKVECQIIPKF